MLNSGREEMERLAEMIAKKMLEKKGADEIIRLANNYCKGSHPRRGLIPRADISSEDARLALNELHFAVNGIRPYPQKGKGGEGGGSLSARNSLNEGGSNKTASGVGCLDPQTYRQQCECVTQGEFDLCTCDPQETPFLCYNEVLYGDPACESVITHSCGLYKCTSSFFCSDAFKGCTVSFYEKPPVCPIGYAGCPVNRPPYMCAHFDCGPNDTARHDCDVGVFGCNDSSGHYNCHDYFKCEPVDQLYKCYLDRYSCASDFQCSTNIGHKCEHRFRCSSAEQIGRVFECAIEFRCNVSEGKFTCEGTSGFECPADVRCSELGSDPVFDCQTYECTGFFNRPVPCTIPSEFNI